MNSLDSRHLRVGDTFAQRFTTPGTYRYTVGVTGSLTDGGDGSFTIKVGEDAGAAPKTYYVGVLFANGAFGVDKETVEIARNDVVMWSTAAAAAPGFAVCGDSGQARFDSAEIEANAMYSHAFGVSGEIAWTDPNEGKCGGVVTVQDQPCHTHDERAAYLEALRKPTLVMIDSGRARPSKVTVVTGQTVFFAVRSSGGISIVDGRLLGASTGDLNPQPLPPGVTSEE
jgi:plastocyanin